jgi:hypothetical protein
MESDALRGFICAGGVLGAIVANVEFADEGRL